MLYNCFSLQQRIFWLLCDAFSQPGDAVGGLLIRLSITVTQKDWTPRVRSLSRENLLGFHCRWGCSRTLSTWDEKWNGACWNNEIRARVWLFAFKLSKSMYGLCEERPVWFWQLVPSTELRMKSEAEGDIRLADSTAYRWRLQEKTKKIALAFSNFFAVSEREQEHGKMSCSNFACQKN